MKLKGKGFFRRQYILLWGLAIFGIAVMILGTTMAIINQAGNCAFTETQRYWCPGSSLPSLSANSTSANATTMPLLTSSASIGNFTSTLLK